MKRQKLEGEVLDECAKTLQCAAIVVAVLQGYTTPEQFVEYGVYETVEHYEKSRDILLSMARDMATIAQLGEPLQ